MARTARRCRRPRRGILKATVGIRLSGTAEEAGIDQAELGMEAYPEFGPSMAS